MRVIRNHVNNIKSDSCCESCMTNSATCQQSLNHCTMFLRKRRKLLIWLLGLLFVMFTLYGAKFLHSFYVYTQMRARLRPGEYVVMFGEFNVEEFLRRQQPDLEQNLFNDLNYLGNTSAGALGRHLPDTRPPLCRAFHSLVHLPTTTIIIVYRNEPRILILRTIFSILFRSPPELIQEIILIDDYCDNEETGRLLSKMHKVTVFKNTNNQGLVNSYNYGVTKVSTSVITFVHATCEVNIGWLEPMLHRLSQVPTALVSPVLDSVHTKTMAYTGSYIWQRGGFDWDMKFHWEKITIGRSENTVIRTPLYMGHVFSIVKDRFVSLGMFDSGLQEYAAENIELSLKSWLCKGYVEILPCSRVGQMNLQAEILGYPPDKENIFYRNVKRVVDVWMDDYKRFFYYTKPSARMLNVGSISERKSLRNKLKCESFRWYMENVYPELKPPQTDEVIFGNIKQNQLCVDIQIGHVPAIAKLSNCDTDKGTQDWSLKKKGEITNGGMCLTSDGVETHGYVLIHFCTGDTSQKWKYNDGQIQREGTNQCLDSHKAEVGLVISDCDDLYTSQKWQFSSKIANVRAKDEV